MSTSVESVQSVAPPTRVLLVDDDADLRFLYQHVLDLEEGFAVVAQATDGLEGVTAAGRHEPDVVLLDMMMPVMDGLVALPLIRQASPHSRIVMLSSLPGHDVVAAALAAGADAFVPKGQPLGTLLAQLKAALGT